MATGSPIGYFMALSVSELLATAETVKNIKEQEAAMREKAAKEARSRGGKKRKKPVYKNRR